MKSECDPRHRLPARLPGRLQPRRHGRGRPRHRASTATRANPVTDGFICAQGPRASPSTSTAPTAAPPGRAARAQGRAGASRACRGTRRSTSSRSGCCERRDGWGGEGDPAVLYGGSNGLLTQDTTDARALPPARRLAAGAHGLRGAHRRARPGPLRQDAGRRATGLRARAADRALGRQPVGVGHPPRAVHPARRRRRGAKLVVVDPRRTPLARAAPTCTCARRPGTDLPRGARAASAGSSRSGHADDGVPGGARDRRRGAARSARRAWTFERAAEETGRRRGGHRARSPSSTPTPSPAVDPMRLGAGAQPQRRLARSPAILALPAVAGQVRRARRRLHDEQLRRLGHRRARWRRRAGAARPA